MRFWSRERKESLHLKKATSLYVATWILSDEDKKSITPNGKGPVQAACRHMHATKQDDVVGGPIILSALEWPE